MPTVRQGKLAQAENDGKRDPMFNALYLTQSINHWICIRYLKFEFSYNGETEAPGSHGQPNM